MLYHYYMKINIKYLLGFLLLIFLYPCTQAQVTIVKQNDNKIYLDISELNQNIAIGDSFKVILSKETLKNPTTGKVLGKINQYSEEGTITDVQPLYAVGELPSTVEVAVGQEVFIENKNSSPVPNPATAPIQKNTNRKIKTYSVLDREIISAVKTDLTPLPDTEIAAIDTKGNLILYSAEDTLLKQIAQYTLPAGKRFLTLSAKDIMDRPYAQLFAVVYDEKNQKIYTQIFQYTDNRLIQINTVPYFVKELGCADDKEIYAQKPFISGAKAGDARELDYDDGRFRLEDDRLSTKGHWLTGVNYYEVQNDEYDNFIYTSSNGRIRLRLKNRKYTESPALFAGAPNRVKYKQDIIPFYPSLQVYGPDGLATLAAIENTTKMGILSEQFGQYSAGKLHFLTYENGILDIRETINLNGFVYDTNCTSHGILVPQVLSSGQTVLAEIYR